MQAGKLNLHYSTSVLKVAINLLPQSARIIHELIGIDSTLQLIEKRGGIRVSIPIKAKANHWLVPVIGIKSLQKLSWYFSGEEIEIPNASQLKSFLFGVKVNQEYINGFSNAHLARKYGYTERGIRKLRSRAKSYLNTE